MNCKTKLFLIIAIILCIGLILFPGCSGGISTTPQDTASTGEDPATPTQDDDDDSPEFVEGEILVRLKSGVEAEEVASSVGGSVIQRFSIGEMNYARIQLPSDSDVSEVVENLDANSDIDFAEPNYLYYLTIIPDDPAYETRQYCHQVMDSEEGWNTTTGSSSTVIAIIDTGVDGTHPEFSGRMTAGYDYVNDEALTGNEDSDYYGHGTHVAGIAGATGNNSEGVAGLNWKAKIMPLVVDGEDWAAWSSNIAQAIQFAADNDADVINMSLGGRGYSQVLKDAVDYAREHDVIIVASMGNDYTRMINYPAAYQGVIAVGSSTPTDEASDFSTRGNHISVTAPGSEIYSTWAGSTYYTASGTSMSSPQVAGLCSLIRGQNPGWSPGQVRSQIEGTADDVKDPGFDIATGYGRINVDSALGAAQSNKYGIIKINVLDSGDPVSGVDVVLRDSGGNTVATCLSNSGGIGWFYDIESGTYNASVYYGGTYQETGNFTLSAGTTEQQTVDF